MKEYKRPLELNHTFLGDFIASAVQQNKLYVMKNCKNKNTGETVDVLAIEINREGETHTLLPVAEFSNTDPYETWEAPGMNDLAIMAGIPISMN